MIITDLFALLGGLALFLYGMKMMSSGLEAAAGNRMKQILERLTSNRFLGVLVGAGITAVIQSSSATTVMAVGFVNSGMMTLKQAVWIIMGANIGTTITGQLIALDVGMIAPLAAFIGVVLVVFFKKKSLNHWGEIIAGLGVLFLGMNLMSEALMPLRESETFINMMTNFSNPVFGVLAGTLFTAIIQSSSASVGILQALASSGLISFSSSVFVLFGQNIGTCITAVLASIGTNRNAKRTTLIHLLFNLIGTVVFTTLCLITPMVDWVGNISPGRPASQIANMHTLFNIATTLLLFPFGTYLAMIATKILPDKLDSKSSQLVFQRGVHKDVYIGSSIINLAQTRNKMQYMMSLAKENVANGFKAFIEKDDSYLEKVEEAEETVDLLNKEISKYISNALAHETNEKVSDMLSCYFVITGNIERISDHAMNICGYSKLLKERGIVFSQSAMQELANMQAICDDLFDNLIGSEKDALDGLTRIAAMEQKIDDMTLQYRNDLLERMKQGISSQEGCIYYSEMLTDFERIGDHALNISQQLTKIAMEE